MENNINRRKFIQASALAGAGLAIPTTETKAQNAPTPTKLKSKIKIGVIGSGFRGQSHIDLALNRDDCEVVAIHDIDKRMIERTKKIFEKKRST